jgi:hypothetical protein
MSNIQPVDFPIIGTAVKLSVLVLNFSTSDVTAGTYYQLLTEEDKVCISGNYQMTEEQFASWGLDNSVVDHYVADFLGITII